MRNNSALGPKLLAKYLRDNDINQSAFSDEMRRSRACVSYWLSGRNAPTKAIARKIEAMTKGAVPADSWKHRKAKPAPTSLGAAMLTQAIELSNLTLHQLAKRRGLDPRQLSRHAAGTHVPSANMVTIINHRLDLELTRDMFQVAA